MLHATELSVTAGTTKGTMVNDWPNIAGVGSCMSSNPLTLS